MISFIPPQPTQSSHLTSGHLQTMETMQDGERGWCVVLLPCVGSGAIAVLFAVCCNTVHAWTFLCSARKPNFWCWCCVFYEYALVFVVWSRIPDARYDTYQYLVVPDILRIQEYRSRAAYRIIRSMYGTRRCAGCLEWNSRAFVRLLSRLNTSYYTTVAIHSTIRHKLLSK